MFRFVVLPDLQSYSDIRIKITQSVFKVGDQRERMFQQLRWVRDNAAAKSIAMVFQEGDLTQTNSPDEWELTESAMRCLDPVVPYILCVGNHDMGYEQNPAPGRFWVSNRRDSLLDDYFPPSRFTGNPLYSYGGNFEGSSENYFLLFEAEGLRFLALSLEFMPRDEALDWADGVVGSHPDRRCVIMTHGFLDSRGRRDLRGHFYPLVGNGAEAIWDRLVSRHANVFLVLSGHDYGESRRTDIGIHGNEVHQVMANYQWWKDGGMGWLRELTFHPTLDRIDVRTYSPVLDEFRRSPSSEFSLSYVMTSDPSVFPGLTPLHMRKLRHFFGLFDANGSGDLEIGDVFPIRDRFANMLGLDFEDPRYVRMGDALTNLWLTHLGSDEVPVLSIREFLGRWNARLLLASRSDADRAAVAGEIHRFASMLFEVVDANEDGRIGAIEFLLFLKALGVNHGELSTFKKLDTNGDGELSADEFRDHAEDFFLGGDPRSVSKDLFGPLGA